MFYITEKRYTGNDHANEMYLDSTVITIQEEPPRERATGDICLQGQCEEFCGWSVFAHGEYPTYEAAREAIQTIFGDTRAIEHPFDVSRSWHFRLGKYIPLGHQASIGWAKPLYSRDMNANMSDSDISLLVARYEADAKEEGMALDTEAVESMMHVERELLAAEEEMQDS